MSKRTIVAAVLACSGLASVNGLAAEPMNRHLTAGRAEIRWL